MKKTLLYLSIPILLLASGGCKKPCYTCWVYIFSAYQIDTINYYGIIKYDTTGGFPETPSQFETCETNSKYTYGDLTITPTTSIDTIINCHLNNY